MDPAAPSLPHDVLSLEEEGALVMLREALADLRARRIPLDVAVLDRALCGVGASRADESGGSGPDCFTFRGAHFSIRSGPPGAGGIEVNFVRRQP
jgi:hypothetical protein